jgi:hypothetical protein
MKEYFEILERAICEGALVAQPGGPGTWQRIVCPLGAEPVVVLVVVVVLLLTGKPGNKY